LRSVSVFIRPIPFRRTFFAALTHPLCSFLYGEVRAAHRQLFDDLPINGFDPR
jgi:hypothetical protein